ISFDYNLLRLFDRGGFPPFVNYLFFGDYVDREIQNLETISLLLCYKIKYSENFFLLRGNHECSVINRVYGFFEECNYRYQSEVFNAMPFTGLVAGKMPLYVWWSITTTEKYRSASTDYSTYRSFKSIYSHRFVVVRSRPLLKRCQANNRGLSYTFGPDVVMETCQKLDIDLIARAHQVVQ
ncbi:hypothetical protein WUBG_14253, partial [Wuchereria bancrofti]